MYVLRTWIPDYNYIVSSLKGHFTVRSILLKFDSFVIHHIPKCWPTWFGLKFCVWSKYFCIADHAMIRSRFEMSVVSVWKWPATFHVRNNTQSIRNLMLSFYLSVTLSCVTIYSIGVNLAFIAAISLACSSSPLAASPQQAAPSLLVLVVLPQEFARLPAAPLAPWSITLGIINLSLICVVAIH